MGGPENGNFPLLYVVKMSFRWWVGSLKTPLCNIKVAPYVKINRNLRTPFSDWSAIQTYFDFYEPIRRCKEICL